MKQLYWLVVACLLAACAEQNAPAPAATTDGNNNMEDPYLWLEDVDGEEALAWAEARNEESLPYLESLPTFAPLQARNLEIYNSDERIASPSIRGEHVFNFWRDADHLRGLWRRMSVDDYIAGSSRWQVLLDLDALADEEQENWVWKGSNCLRPDYQRCLLSLSRGGADATVIREFDIESGQFVEDGFFLPEAKSRVSWVDDKSLYVGSDFGDGSLTESGYPRTARVWSRGTPIEEAEQIFEGKADDVGAGVYRLWDGDRHYDIAYRSPTTFTAKRYLYSADDGPALIAIPDDASMAAIHKGQLLVELKSDWSTGGETFPQGALISTDLDAFMAGSRDFDILFEPDAKTAIKRGGVATTRDYVLLNLMQDVVGKVVRLSFDEDGWQRSEIAVEPFGTISFASADDESNLFLFYQESFLRPDTLYLSDDGGENITPLKTLPAFFDTSGMSVEQHFATSPDGTAVPYFVVKPAGFVADGKTPTLIGAYGGFQVSRTPRYSATLGHSWLARGGVYVLANIRGGGEYGPAWHRAGMKENRQRVYDDFIAVAEDLVRRGITSPEHLGIRGGSNGGLLTGVMLTQRPDLFAGVVVQVPLLDMKRYHKLLAGASWMEEYGDPDTDDWEYIREYSPYHNIRPDADYPTAFFTTSTRDDRVHPAHARKMVARMQEMGHELYYYENIVGGHAGASDYNQAARNEALIYSYLWDRLREEERE